MCWKIYKLSKRHAPLDLCLQEHWIILNLQTGQPTLCWPNFVLRLLCQGMTRAGLCQVISSMDSQGALKSAFLNKNTGAAMHTLTPEGTPVVYHINLAPVLGMQTWAYSYFISRGPAASSSLDRPVPLISISCSKLCNPACCYTLAHVTTA